MFVKVSKLLLYVVFRADWKQLSGFDKGELLEVFTTVKHKDGLLKHVSIIMLNVGFFKENSLRRTCVGSVIVKDVDVLFI